MCHFMSFAISVDGKSLYHSNLQSHAEIEEQNKLKPNSYREAEWTDETPQSLVVRRTGDDPDENFFKAFILSQFPTRMDLLNHFLMNKKFVGNLDLRGSQITKLPEGLKVGGSLDLHGTQITTVPTVLKSKVVR